MYGGVGRGKSFLMDCFFNAVPLKRKTRLHFHEFMREVHRELADLQGTVNPLDVLGKRMAKRYKLICFDEFHVADITDAMILHRLLAALFDNGVGFVTTSNFKPDDLYPNGLHRDRILPAIACSTSAGSRQRGQRHRLPPPHLEQVKLYHTPLGPEADAAMRGRLTSWPRCTTKTRCCTSRRARSARAARRAAWCGLTSRRCAVARARRTTTWKSPPSSTPCCCDVPADAVRMASEARRFTWLVDVLYDRRVKLIMSAAVPPEQLYTEGPLAHEFPRTVSRA
jgi:cell division protein ZapE